MKKIISLVLVCIICAAALFSCAKAKLTEKDILDDNGNKIATGFYDGDRLVREEKTDSNGDISEKKTYNEDGKVEKVESYTLGILFTEEEYKYEKEEGSYSKSTVTYNNKGKVVSNKETKYENSLPVEETVTTPLSDGESTVEKCKYTYNEDGTVLLTITSDGKKIRENLLDKDGKNVYDFEIGDESSVKTFYGEKNTVLKKETYNKDNKLTVTIENEYNEDGKQTGAKTYNAKGELVDYSTYVYSGEGKLLAIYKYNADDTIKVSYTYDENGKVTIHNGVYIPVGE